MHHTWSEAAVDATLAESFPASDPPAWNAGITRPSPGRQTADRVTTGPRRLEPGTIDVSRPSRAQPSFVQALMLVAGAAGIALLAPFAILLVGLPLVLVVRGLLEAVLWLVAAVR